MLQGIVGLLIFGFIALAVVVLVVINFTYKSFKQIRHSVEENLARSQKIKEQKDKNPFGDDYFRSAGGSTAQQEEKRQQQKRQQQQRQRQQQETTAHRKTTDSGVTIIDDRTEDKKIFKQDDGEYVEFEEVG